MVYFANKFVQFLPHAVLTVVNFYPQCALTDSLLKLSTIDSTVKACEKICRDAHDCNSIKELCSVQPDCCRK